MDYFTEYRWPGNIRELENVIERLVVLAQDDVIRVSDLPEALRGVPEAKNTLRLTLPPEGISFESIEKELLLVALRKFKWNQSRAARYLDLSRKTLIYRMEKFNLRPEPGEMDEAEGEGGEE
jgi:two-component system NtrC family response regulator